MSNLASTKLREFLEADPQATQAFLHEEIKRGELTIGQVLDALRDIENDRPWAQSSVLTAPVLRDMATALQFADQPGYAQWMKENSHSRAAGLTMVLPNLPDSSGHQSAEGERTDDKKPDLGIAFRNSLIATAIVATPAVAILLSVFESSGKYLFALASVVVLGIMYFFVDLFLLFGKRRD